MYFMKRPKYIIILELETRKDWAYSNKKEIHFHIQISKYLANLFFFCTKFVMGLHFQLTKHGDKISKSFIKEKGDWKPLKIDSFSVACARPFALRQIHDLESMPAGLKIATIINVINLLK